MILSIWHIFILGGADRECGCDFKFYYYKLYVMDGWLWNVFVYCYEYPSSSFVDNSGGSVFPVDVVISEFECTCGF